jgi:opine dehydrogenase
MAGHLAMMGHEVNLFNRSPEPLEGIGAAGGIRLEGAVQGHGRPMLLTSNIGEAIVGAELIMVAVPASAHEWVAEAMAPHLRSGQILVLNPGRTGGALEFQNVLRETGVVADVVVAEAQTFIYASRRIAPGHSRIFRVKHSVPLAALPANRTEQVIRLLGPILPQFIPAASVLKTSLDNIGAVFHPTICLLNAGWIENSQGDFEFYLGGVTPAVARMVEAVDRERTAVARALRVKAMSALEFLEMAYGRHADNLYEAMKGNRAYAGIRAPRALRHRYLIEDVPTGLVPMASIGSMLGVPTPNINALIQMASELHATSFWEIGRTVENLGIAGATVDEIRRYVYEGGPRSWSRQ